MKIVIECTEQEKSEWIKFNQTRCPFAPCFTKNCDKGSGCDKCIEENIKFKTQYRRGSLFGKGEKVL